MPPWQESSRERRRILLFAVLAHDFGKPSTTAQVIKRDILRWTSPGHEAAGEPFAISFLQRIGAPQAIIDPVVPLVVNHLVHHRGPKSEFGDTQVRRLAQRIAPATIDDLALVMLADSFGRPPLYSPETINLIEKLKAKSRALAIASQAPRPILLGRHLIELGEKPGPAFKPILDAAFEAQLDGVFTHEAGAMAWARNHLRRSPSMN